MLEKCINTWPSDNRSDWSELEATEEQGNRVRGKHGIWDTDNAEYYYVASSRMVVGASTTPYSSKHLVACRCIPATSPPNTCAALRHPLLEVLRDALEIYVTFNTSIQNCSSDSRLIMAEIFQSLFSVRMSIEKLGRRRGARRVVT
jgi:hypothetical protein